MNVTTEAMGYRQGYRRLGPGEHGYRRRIVRISDGVVMYAGPGDLGYPSISHPQWNALPREERLAIRAVLDAADELTGIADYLSERSGRDALAKAAFARGADPREWQGREADNVRREASQAEYELVLRSGLAQARERLDRMLRRDRDAEATRRVLAILGIADLRAATGLAIRPGMVQEEPGSPPRIEWLAMEDPRWQVPPGGPGDWTLGTGLLPCGLIDMAGLCFDGSIGPARNDSVRVDSVRVSEWQHCLARNDVARSPEVATSHVEWPRRKP